MKLLTGDRARSLWSESKSLTRSDYGNCVINRAARYMDYWYNGRILRVPSETTGENYFQVPAYWEVEYYE